MSVKKEVPSYEDPTQLYTKIEEASRYYRLSRDISVLVLQRWINETPVPINFITRVFKEAYFESEVEAEKLLDLLTRLWNVTPRDDLGGMSPQQKFALELSKGHKSYGN